MAGNPHTHLPPKLGRQTCSLLYPSLHILPRALQPREIIQMGRGCLASSQCFVSFCHMILAHLQERSLSTEIGVSPEHWQMCPINFQLAQTSGGAETETWGIFSLAAAVSGTDFVTTGELSQDQGNNSPRKEN